MGKIDDHIKSLTSEEYKIFSEKIKNMKRKADAETQKDPAFVCGMNKYDPFPLSDIQKAHWVGYQSVFRWGDAAANVYMELDFGKIDSDFESRLAKAMERLAQRHGILRVCLTGEMEQKVQENAAPCKLDIIDLRQETSEHQKKILCDIRERAQFTHLPLDTVPLYTLTLLRRSDVEATLCVVMSTLIIDGMSRLILGYEIRRLLDDPEADLGEIGCDYRDAVIYTAEIRKNSPPATLLPSGETAASTTLPPPYKEPHSSRHKIEIIEDILLTPAQWAGIKKEGARRGYSPSVLVIAAFAYMCSRTLGMENFILPLLSTNRPRIHPDIDRVLGNFNDITPMSFECGDVSYAHIAHGLQLQVAQFLKNPPISGFDVLKDVGRNKVRSGEILAPVIFNSIIELAQWERQNIGKNIDRHRYTMNENFYGFYVPHVVWLPTIGEMPDESLYCRWQGIPEAMSDGFLSESLSAYKMLLVNLASSPESWDDKKILEGARVFLGIMKPELRAASPPESGADNVVRDIIKMITENFTYAGTDPDTDLFDQNMESFDIVQLILKIKKKYHVSLSPDELFPFPTIRKIALILNRKVS